MRQRPSPGWEGRARSGGTERCHCVAQRLRLFLQRQRRSCCLLDQRRVLLGHFIHLRDSLVDLLDAGRLLAAVDISKDGDSTHSRGDDPPSRALRAALARAFRVEALAPQAAADPRSNATASGAAPIGTTPYRWSVGAHLPRVTLPADNPLTVQGVALGRQLFGDPRLSRDGRISCATCHVPDRAFVDPGRATSRGIDGREGQRNTPALSNLAWSRHFGWDGGRSTLREQALLYANLKSQFEPQWYWSGQAHETNSSWAWCQRFSRGTQSSYHEDRELRARAVRRLPI